MDDVADSTDWLNTPLSGLAPLESGLRCQVCKDFFTTPMITSCSHTFCSLCIRRYLSQEGRCPACRETDQEMKLRRNWTVEELVAHFTQSRDQILGFARRPPPQQSSLDSQRPKKRRKIETASNSAERRSTRSQSKRLVTSASQASPELASTQEEVADSEDEGSIYRDGEDKTTQVQSTSQQPARGDQQPNDGLVACPCCNRRMKETAINAHLDRCIQGIPTSPDPPTAPLPTANSASLAFAQRTKSPIVIAQKERLPSINYALSSEASLRKKLKELGIPNHGNKELMKKRHTEWVNLWNANCDSSRPRTKRDVLKDLDTWERTLGRQLEKGTANGSSGVMVKDFDRDGWVRNQKDEFDDLIKKARARKQATTTLAREDGSHNPAVDEDTNMTETEAGGSNVVIGRVSLDNPVDPGNELFAVGRVSSQKDTNFDNTNSEVTFLPQDQGHTKLPPSTNGISKEPQQDPAAEPQATAGSNHALSSNEDRDVGDEHLLAHQDMSPRKPSKFFV